MLLALLVLFLLLVSLLPLRLNDNLYLSDNLRLSADVQLFRNLYLCCGCAREQKRKRFVHSVELTLQIIRSCRG